MMQMRVEHVPCPLCGSQDHVPWGRENGFAAVRCQGCGLLYVTPRPAAGEIAEANRLGLVVTPLTDDEKKELKVKGGLKIEQIVSSTRNLQEGDVILAIVNKGAITEVTSVAQLNQLLSRLETGSNVTLQIRRGENTAFLSARVGE